MGWDAPFRYNGPCNSTVSHSQINTYQCPSDPNAGMTNTAYGARSGNYAVNYGNGDQAQNPAETVVAPWNPNVNIVFNGAPFTDMGSPLIDISGYALGMVNTTPAKIASITDGLSNTLMASEIKIVNVTNGDLRGYFFWGPSASFNTTIPPNSIYPDVMGNGGCPSPTTVPCNGGVQFSNSSNTEVYLSARGYHPGGVNAVMCDGSVKFFKNTVNPVTWMAVGSSRGNEVVSADQY